VISIMRESDPGTVERSLLWLGRSVRSPRPQHPVAFPFRKRTPGN